MHRSVRPVLLAFCGMVLTACSFSVSVGNDISKADLEKNISTVLEQSNNGRRPDSVTCPGPIKAENGQTARCFLTGGGAKYGLTVTLSEVNGSKATYDVKVDDKPMQ
ncbi:DUF4333 domain-containing protein [Amycolatopsis circi]|uniref:DUF4333 domain-containing protein n=1 Tax=Amycolatopsis circi TaxID=871959 RepID=UPI001ABF58BA|nr:DUF4333 domain-containing protein [Amycolatopsis circi]